MRIGPLHLLTAWLVAGTLLLQSLGAVMPSGSSLCIGCEEGGWSIAQPVTVPGGGACCADEIGQADGREVTLRDADECGCLRIPIGAGFDLMPPVARAKAPGVQALLPTSVVACVARVEAPELAFRAPGPRAGPMTPVRLLAPMSRCTVLLL